MIATEINVILLGDNFVGKTSIIRRIKDKTFENEQPTIGIDFYTVKIKYERKNALISLFFIDTNGMEITQFQYSNYIRNSHIILLVFSDLQSFDV